MGTRHSAPAAPASGPSLPSQSHSCPCRWNSSIRFSSLTALNWATAGGRLLGPGFYCLRQAQKRNRNGSCDLSIKNMQKGLTRPLCIRSHEALPMTRWGGPPPLPPGMHATPPTQTSVVSRPLDLAFVTVHWRWTIRRKGNTCAALHRHRAFLQGTTASKLQDALPKAIRCACPVAQGVGRTRVGDAAQAAHDNVCGHGPDPPCTVWGLWCPSVVPLFDDVPL